MKPADNLGLIEQYKLYVEMSDRISERRSKANQFYMVLLSLLLIVASLVVNQGSKEGFTNHQQIVLLAMGITGLLTCTVWFININSYRQLNTAKFKVIHEMEANLSYACYSQEWELLGHGTDASKYNQLTKVERWVPVILMCPYALLIVYSTTLILG
ncbi:MAG: hypothetical protein JXR03_21000 [Cyclobacteriaceae bacterium]